MAANTLPRTELSGVQWATEDIAALAITGPKLFNLGIQQDKAAFGTVAVDTGATEGTLLRAPFAGTIVGCSFSTASSLSADNTNYVTFGIINKGATGAGTTQLLTTSPAGVNTTKVTGGTAIVAYERHVLTPTTTAVAAGDILRPTITVSGTLAGTLVNAVMHVLFQPA